MRRLRVEIDLPYPASITPSNLLTIARVLLTPVVFFASLTGFPLLAMGAYGAGILSDAIDGRIARFTHTPSEFGRAFDSTADKCLVVAAMMALALHGELPIVVSFAFVLREFLVFGLRTMRTPTGARIAEINDRLGRWRFFILHSGLLLLLLPGRHGPVHLAGVAVVITAIAGAYGTLGYYLKHDWRQVRACMQVDEFE